jgi:hypothetical protein
MGNPRVMPVKIVWDFVVYWGFLALQFLGGRLCDLPLLERAGRDLHHVNHLNARMQAFFRQWDALDCPVVEERFIDVLGVDLMRRFHLELLDQLPGDRLLARFSQNLRLLESLAVAIFQEAAQHLPGVGRCPVNPYAITLDREVWHAEGLFDVASAVGVEEVAAASIDRVRVTPVGVPVEADVASAY